MKLKLNLIGVLVTFLIMAGCATIGEYAEIMRPHGLSREYSRALDEWTRERTVYSEFSTRAKMVSTLRSREFVQSFLDEYGRVYLVEPGVDEAEHPAIEAADYVTEFLLYVYVPDRDAIDLERSDSIWKAFLFSAHGERFEPLEIRELREVSPLVTEMYPYVNPAYGKVYLLKFPGEASGTEGTELPLTLVVTSVIARVELVWENSNQ